MDIINTVRSLPGRVITTCRSTSRKTRLIILAIHALLATFLFVFRVSFGGWWYYYNERIFITRGFGVDDTQKCLPIMKDSEWKGGWAKEWYWRMQCLGNRDGLKVGGVWTLLNRRWVWIIFDAFWVSFAGPCVYAATYSITTMSRIYDSDPTSPIAPFIKPPFGALRNLLLAGATWVTRLIAAYASYFDLVPHIKNTFGRVGDWLSDMASSEYWYRQIVDRQYPLAENSINFLWTYAVAVVTAVIVTSMDIYNAFSAYFSGIGSAPLNHLLLFTNGGLWSGLVPETGIPNWSLLMLSTIWINVYMHRKYNIPHPRALDAPSHWTSNLSHTPYALLDVICFGSEPVPVPGSAEPFPVQRGVDWPARPVFEELTPSRLEWHWDEIPDLSLQKVILPIVYDGVWDGFLFCAIRFLFACDFIHAASRKAWRMTFGKIGMLAVITYLTYNFPEFKYLLTHIATYGGGGLLVAGVCVMVIFVSSSVFNILKGAWDTVFSRKPFSQLRPSTPGLYTMIIPMLFSQLLVIALMYGFNSITSAMRIPLTLTYTTFLLYAMASDILEVWSDDLQLGVSDTVGRVLALACYYLGGWVPAPWFWTPDHIATKPLFHWYRGIATTFIYDGLSFSTAPNLFWDFCIGFVLLLNYLRIPGRKHILRQCSIETQAILLGNTAMITTFQACVLAFVGVIEVFFAFTIPQLAIMYALLWGAYLLWDPKLPYPPPNDSPSADKETASSVLLSLQTTLRRTIGLSIIVLLTLLVPVQLSDDPYVENEWTRGFPLISSWAMLVAGVFFIAHALASLIPSNPSTRRVYRWFAKQQYHVVKLKQFGNLLQNARQSAGNRFKNEWQLDLEYIAQIGALLFTIYALTYLSFSLAFFSLAVPGLLLFLYNRSPAAENDHTRTRPHGLQTIYSNGLVPTWAKHLWWIIPTWTTLQSVVIIRHSEAIHQYFQDFTWAYYSYSWYDISLPETICGFLWLAVIILGPVREQQHLLKFLWTAGSFVTCFLPFDTRPVRDMFFFRSASVSTFQPRLMTPLIHSWLILVLQAYRPGPWLFLIALLFWDIVKVEDPSSEPSSKMTADQIAAAAAAEEVFATLLRFEKGEAEPLAHEKLLEIATREEAEAETKQLKEQDETEARAEQEQASKELKDKEEAGADAKANVTKELKNYQEKLASEFEKQKISKSRILTSMPAPSPEQPVELGIKGLVDEFGLEPESGGEPSEDDVPIDSGEQDHPELDPSDKVPDLSANSAQSIKKQKPAAQKISGPSM